MSARIASTMLLALLVCGGCKEERRRAGPAANSNSSVALTENSPVPAAPTKPLVDWSKSNSVSIVLGDESDYGGLKHNDKERDGITTIVKVDETRCRLLNHKERGRAEAFLYFSLDPAFKASGATNVKVDVEYFDVLLDETRTSFEFITTRLGTAARSVRVIAALAKRWR